jgi:hypothetical protein
MDIYNEDITYELTDDEIQEIETQMMTEFNILTDNNKYIINGNEFSLRSFWSSYNPLSNIHYVLSNTFGNAFDSSLTDELCRKIHYKHKAIVDAETAKNIIIRQGDW